MNNKTEIIYHHFRYLDSKEVAIIFLIELTSTLTSRDVDTIIKELILIIKELILKDIIQDKPLGWNSSQSSPYFWDLCLSFDLCPCIRLYCNREGWSWEIVKPNGFHTYR